MQMDIKKILVTGANGQLGNELRLMSENFPQFEYLFTDVAELDICNAEAVNAFVEQNKVDAIINCAAYTAVDKAENEEQKAAKVEKSEAEVETKTEERTLSDVLRSDESISKEDKTEDKTEEKTNVEEEKKEDDGEFSSLSDFLKGEK